MGDIKRIGLRMQIFSFIFLYLISKRYGIPVANLINFIVAQWVDNQLYVRDKLIETFKGELIKSVKVGDFDGC